jgi:arylsulfatase A-like enzyme
LFRTFQDAGYATGYFGKWHLSDDRGIDDEAFGLDQAQERSGSAGDAGVAAAAAEWIGRSRDEPWLAIVSLLQPHDIYEFPGRRDELASKGKQAPVRPGMEAPASGVGLLSKRPKPQRLFNEQDQGRATNDYGPEDWRRYRSFYYDLIEDADRDLGTALDAVGDLDDTIVFYSSDHGDALGEHGLAFKGPFAYEELLNVPLTISWPRMFSEARSSEELVSHIDVLPTACDLAGVEAPGGIDGVSLRPALAGKSLGREEIFAEYHSKQRWANPMRMVREKRWKLNVYLDGGRELYDLENDPHELNNLAGEARARPEEERLMAKLEDWAARTNDTRWFARK